MANNQVTKAKELQRTYPLLTGEERLSILEKLRGMWRNRKPDPIKELEKMRKEWDRDPLSS